MKKVLLWLLLILAILTFFFYLSRFIKASSLVGADRDEHDCIGSAGYSWCEAKQKCLRVWEEPCTLDQDEESILKEAIKTAIVEKRGAVAEDLVIKVSKIEGGFASGGSGSATPGVGGAMWFAAKVKGNWLLVWDGNGIITCEEVAPYPDFPTSFIPQCYDTEVGKMFER